MPSTRRPSRRWRRCRRKYGIAEAPSTQVIQPPPVTAAPTVTVTAAAIPPPTRTPMPFDWMLRLQAGALPVPWQFSEHWPGMLPVLRDFVTAALSASRRQYWSSAISGNSAETPNTCLLPVRNGASRTEQAYRTIEDMSPSKPPNRANFTRAWRIHRSVAGLYRITIDKLNQLIHEVRWTRCPDLPGHAAAARRALSPQDDCHAAGDCRVDDSATPRPLGWNFDVTHGSC